VTTALCPNGHASDEADYCSVCGAPIGGTGAAPAPPAGGCPSCGTPRDDSGARYCEVCRYDFESGEPGPPPVAVAAPSVAVAAPSVAGAAAVAAPGAVPGPAAPRWEVAVVVDPSLDLDPDPATPAPEGVGERVFPVDLPEMLVGRRDDRHDIRPDIPIQDPAVSRRHAKLLRLPDGGLAVLDLASANGTAVNGVETPAGARQTLADGDTLTLGRWTRITVRSAP